MSRYWLEPVEYNDFKVIEASLLDVGYYHWYQKHDYKENDVIYFFVKEPVYKILYKGIVISKPYYLPLDNDHTRSAKQDEKYVDGPFVEVDYMDNFEKEQEFFTLDKLNENGLGDYSGGILLDGKILEYIIFIDESRFEKGIGSC